MAVLRNPSVWTPIGISLCEKDQQNLLNKVIDSGKIKGSPGSEWENQNQVEPFGC